MLDRPMGLFDHDNAHKTLQTVKEIRRQVAGLGDASVSVISGPRSANKARPGRT